MPADSHRGRASMGPPRERDGEPGPSKRDQRDGPRFNGAAARTRRRAAGGTAHGGARASLQWGRRANATERPLEIVGSAVGAGLQWGRRANATESLTRSGAARGGRELQWGRRANATESVLASARSEERRVG